MTEQYSFTGAKNWWLRSSGLPSYEVSTILLACHVIENNTFRHSNRETTVSSFIYIYIYQFKCWLETRRCELLVVIRPGFKFRFCYPWANWAINLRLIRENYRLLYLDMYVCVQAHELPLVYCWRRGLSCGNRLRIVSCPMLRINHRRMIYLSTEIG